MWKLLTVSLRCTALGGQGSGQTLVPEFLDSNDRNTFHCETCENPFLSFFIHKVVALSQIPQPEIEPGLRWGDGTPSIIWAADRGDFGHASQICARNGTLTADTDPSSKNHELALSSFDCPTVATFAVTQ